MVIIGLSTCIYALVKGSFVNISFSCRQGIGTGILYGEYDFWTIFSVSDYIAAGRLINANAYHILGIIGCEILKLFSLPAGSWSADWIASHRCHNNVNRVLKSCLQRYITLLDSFFFCVNNYSCWIHELNFLLPYTLFEHSRNRKYKKREKKKVLKNEASTITATPWISYSHVSFFPML